MENLFGNYRQMQAIADKPTKIDRSTRVVHLTQSPVVQVQTLVSSGAIELGNPLADRQRLIVRNQDPIRRARIGGAGVTEKLGIILEPLEEITFEIPEEQTVTIYGRAMYAEIKVEVTEA